MSIKGQLNASRDFLMAGMRAAARGSTPNQQAERLVRACLDLVEHLARQSENVSHLNPAKIANASDHICTQAWWLVVSATAVTGKTNNGSAATFGQ